MTELVDLVYVTLAGTPRVIRVLDAAAPVTIDAEDLGAPADALPLFLRPDLDATWASPFEPGVRVVLANVVTGDGEPSPFCTRSVLQRTIASSGHEAVLATEVEFYLLAAGTQRPVYEEIDHYGVARGAAYEEVLRVVRALSAVGLPVEASNPEYAGGQFEVNLHHGPALRAIDATVVLRAFVAAAARRAGLRATFMAKPWSEHAGSGMHIHQSLWRDGTNVFWDADGLSASGRDYVGGLLAAMPELAPLGTPTANGYRRRADWSFCPTSACWGGDNRTVAVRAITGDPRTTRVEQRDAAADCNPYLAAAGQLHAGLAGMAAAGGCPDPVTGNAYGRADLPPLPPSLELALPAFAASTRACALLGEPLHEALVARARAEVDRARVAVGEWERELHLEATA